MSFEESCRYQAAPDAVFAFLTDPGQLIARFEAAGDRDVEVVRCAPDGDEFVVEVRREVTIDLPGFARKVLGETNTTVQRERWSAPAEDGTRQAGYEIEAVGTPVRTRGTFRLAPDGTGTTHTVDGTMDVKVPLIGGRLGSFLDGTARDRVRADFAFNAEHLG